MGSSKAMSSSGFVFVFIVLMTRSDSDLDQITQHIFLGPTSTLNMALKKGTKSFNVFLHDMTTVEPEHIAYVCVQVN